MGGNFTRGISSTITLGPGGTLQIGTSGTGGTLVGSNSFTGLATISAGTLEFGGGGTIVSDITNISILGFGGAGASEYAAFSAAENRVCQKCAENVRRKPSLTGSRQGTISRD